jgi:hypothetical protein
MLVFLFLVCRRLVGDVEFHAAGSKMPTPMPGLDANIVGVWGDGNTASLKGALVQIFLSCQPTPAQKMEKSRSG